MVVVPASILSVSRPSALRFGEQREDSGLVGGGDAMYADQVATGRKPSVKDRLHGAVATDLGSGRQTAGVKRLDSCCHLSVFAFLFVVSRLLPLGFLD